MQAARKLKQPVMTPLAVEDYDNTLISYVIDSSGETIQFRAFLLTGGGLFSPDGVRLGSGASMNDFDAATKRRVGSGASGQVFYVLHTKTQTPMALKMIPITTKNHRDEIEAELRILRQNMRNRHIVQNFDAFWDPDNSSICIPMEWMAYSLHDLSHYLGPFTEQQVAAVAYQLLLALQYLHETQHVIHRDIKTSNILVAADGVVKLGDFGISKQMKTYDPCCSSYKGTQLFMAPERLDSANHSFPSDIWSLALTLVSLAIGKNNPWAGPHGGEEISVFAMMQRIHEGQVPMFPPTFSQVAHHFLSLCLQPDPDQRPPASELLKHQFVRDCDEATTSAVVKQMIDRVTEIAVSNSHKHRRQSNTAGDPSAALQMLDDVIDNY